MLENILLYMKVILIDHIGDWLITAIITYFAVKVGTKQYYDANRVEISKHIMQFGIKSMINLGYSEPVPDSFKVIFVEYGKRAFFLKKRQIEKLKRKGYEKKRFGLMPDLRSGC